MLFENLRISALYISLLIFSCFKAQAQENFRAMFYNVENLFDTIKSPNINDKDFTPDGVLHWNSKRYNKKIKDLSKAIMGVGGEFPPAIIGLCEVENKNVIIDLVNSPILKNDDYRYVITNSKDPRGSNIAFLYQRDQFKYITRKSHRPNLSMGFKTRDILQVTGEIVSGDTLDVFLAHFPSRVKGEKMSEPSRREVAKLLRKKIDKVMSERENPNIIVMGDFNDYPTNNSLKLDLKTKRVDETKNKWLSNELYNMFEDKDNEEIKSYKYQGEWGYLDQIIVNGNLLDDKSTCFTKAIDGRVYSSNYLLDYDEKYGGYKPFRTYSGWKYLGGTSDHLPVYIDIMIKE